MAGVTVTEKTKSAKTSGSSIKSHDPSVRSRESERPYLDLVVKHTLLLTGPALPADDNLHVGESLESCDTVKVVKPDSEPKSTEESDLDADEKDVLHSKDAEKKATGSHE